MCSAVYTPSGVRLGCVRDLRAAGIPIDPADLTTPAETIVMDDGSVIEVPEYTASEGECFCGLDPEPILNRAGIAFTYEPELSDYVLATEPPGAPEESEA